MTHGIGVLSERNGVPESSRRKRAAANALSALRPQAACSPMWWGSSAISSVGASAQRRRWIARAGRDRLVGHGHAVAIARLGPRRVGPVGLEVDAVAGGVGGPLAAMWVVGATTPTRATRPSESIRWATLSPKVVLPAAGVAEARKERWGWASTASTASPCQLRRGRPAGHAGSVESGMNGAGS